MAEDVLYVALEYKPKLLSFFPKDGLCILENETNKKQVKFTIIRRGIRKIFEFQPQYIRFDDEYSKRVKMLQAVVIRPIFAELERARLLKCHRNLKKNI